MKTTQKTKKRALITGVTGMDGSHLVDHLLSEGYRVFGIVRRTSSFNTVRIDHVKNDIELMYGDLLDPSSLTKIIQQVRPHEIYNLGAMSHVRVSFDVPQNTVDVTGGGVLNLLEAIRANNMENSVRVYQAGSSEMFGDVLSTPQNENTPFNPCSPYGCAKAFAHYICKVYRYSYGMFISNGILFNHESIRRAENFVTQKIARAAVNIFLGNQKYVELGNLAAKRDWGHAPDYVYAMWLMLQHDTPDDFVVATGATHSVQEFADLAFACVGLQSKDFIKTNLRLFRPCEVNLLLGDSTKIRRVLGWKPTTTFRELVSLMVDNWVKVLHKN